MSPPTLELEVLGRRLVTLGLAPELTDDLAEFWSAPAGILEPREWPVRLTAIPAAPAGFPAELARPITVLESTFGLVDADPVLWLGDRDEGLRLELSAGRATIDLWGDPAGQSEMLQLAVGEAMVASGLVSIHAAVAARDGRATAFLGPSGRGKTTTLLRALEAGWTPVGEDLAWLDPGTLAITGLGGGLRLLPDTAALVLSRIPGASFQPAVGGKLFVAYEQLGTRRMPAHLTRLALLERDPERDSSWAPCSPRDAAVALWEATGVPLSSDGRQRVSSWITGVLRSVELSRLVLGGNPLPL